MRYFRYTFQTVKSVQNSLKFAYFAHCFRRDETELYLSEFQQKLNDDFGDYRVDPKSCFATPANTKLREIGTLNHRFHSTKKKKLKLKPVRDA